MCNWPTSQIKTKNSDVRAFYISGYVMDTDPHLEELSKSMPTWVGGHQIVKVNIVCFDVARDAIAV